MLPYKSRFTSQSKTGRPGTAIDPFQSALMSAARLREFTTTAGVPMQKPPDNVSMAPGPGSATGGQLPRGFQPGPPTPPAANYGGIGVAPGGGALSGAAGAFGPGESAGGAFRPGTGDVGGAFGPGPPRDGVFTPGGPIGTTPTFSHYDENGQSVYIQYQRGETPRPGENTRNGTGGIVPPHMTGTGATPGGQLPRDHRPGPPTAPPITPGGTGVPPGGGAPVVPVTTPPPAAAQPIDDRVQRYRQIKGQINGKSYDYGYITPEIIAQFDADMARARNTIDAAHPDGYRDINITDWLRIRGYDSPIDRDTVRNMPDWLRNSSVSTRPNDRQTGIPTRFGQSTKPTFIPGVAGPVGTTFPGTGTATSGGGAVANWLPPGAGGGATGTIGTEATGAPATGANGAAPTAPIAPQGSEDILARTIQEISNRYQPGFARDRDDLQQRLMQTGALSGALNAGGFTDVVGDELVNLASKQSAQLGEEISKQTMNERQFAMQKYVAELNDSFSRLQLKTNADLEAKAQELQKYGIDKGDLLERYKAELQLKGQTYSADKQVDAAAMQAAASGAAAAAQAAASKYNADRDYQLGLVNADINREQGVMQFVLGLSGQNSDWMKWFLASDPFSVLTGSQVPGDVVVKP